MTRHKTLGDAVLEHASQDSGGTDGGIRMLELDGAITAGSLNGAANLYLAALSIIKKQKESLARAEDRLNANAIADVFKAAGELTFTLGAANLGGQYARLAMALDKAIEKAKPQAPSETGKDKK